MRIAIPDLEREPIEFDRFFPPEAIGYGAEVRQIGALHSNGRADLIREHRGPREIVPDIRLQAEFEGRFEAPCARCVEPVEHRLKSAFDLIFRPLGVDAEMADHAISTSETEIGYYEGNGLELEDVLREQVLLSLPAKTLCGPDCKGLCPHCGKNLNTGACACEKTAEDPRWGALSDLRSRIGS
jgi:uncharacterized protein